MVFPAWLIAIIGGWKRIDWKALGIAVAVGAVLIGFWVVVAKLVDGAVADWKAAQERETSAILRRSEAAAAQARAQYEPQLREAGERTAELERELAALKDDPVIFPPEVVRSLNR